MRLRNVKDALEKLKEALEFIQTLVKENKTILFVGTKIQIRNLVKEMASDCEMPYVATRWLGGTFTNFGTILKRIEYFKELEKKKTGGELDHYTKKERLKIDRELRDLEEKFGGLKNLQSLPDAVFIVDMKKNETAVREAKKKNIKIIAICHTNVDPTLADFPIPANDDSISSVRYILEKVKEVILNAKLKTQNAKPQLKT